MQCPSCHSVNVEIARFCGRCGGGLTGRHGSGICLAACGLAGGVLVLAAVIAWGCLTGRPGAAREPSAGAPQGGVEIQRHWSKSDGAQLDVRRLGIPAEAESTDHARCAVGQLNGACSKLKARRERGQVGPRPP